MTSDPELANETTRSGTGRWDGLWSSFGPLRSRIRTHRKLDLAYRIGVAIVGALIVAGGIVLLPLPGPGWLIIFLGIGAWASEFAWAKRLLQFARRNVAAWTHWVGRQPWWIRALLGLVVLVVVAAAVAGYVAWKGLPGWIPFVG